MRKPPKVRASLSQHNSSTTTPGDHRLHKELGVWDLVPMQVLLVVGLTWAGLAARQGEAHIVFWLLGILLFFLPLAGVVHYCTRVWPLEGGVYQWTKHALGPFAGFLSAWNFGVWAVLVVANLGIVTAASLSYALGPWAAWMADSGTVIQALNIGLFAFILLVNIPGFSIGRWVAHFGTAVMLLLTAILIVLLFIHPHETPAHPHISPQRPLTLALPVLSAMSLNLFSKLSFNALTGLEQVAVFAGEIRNPARAILRSAWLAAPLIALIYIGMSGAMLTYTPADKIDLTAPIPQVLTAAFGSQAGSNGPIDWGGLLGRFGILALAVAVVAQYAVIVAETSRLPMVAAWDHLLPAWFTRLHPRFGTPTRSLVVIVVIVVACAMLASAGTKAQEAFQLLVVAGNVCYGINYLLMFAVPLAAGTRFGPRPGIFLRIACVSGIALTLMQIVFALFPVVDVNSSWSFGLKVVLTVVAANLAGGFLYWRGMRATAFVGSTLAARSR